MTSNLFRVAESKLDSVGPMIAREDWMSFGKVLQPCEETFADKALDALFARALEIYADPSEYSELDAYLAARLHLCIRLPRRTAGDPGIWCWLAVSVCRQYMLHRWPFDEERRDQVLWRYTSKDVLRNGISRLWWAAELVRDGPDYSLVPAALARVRTFQNVSELRYSWHRECARAMTMVLRKHDDSGDQLGPLFNAYLKTQSLELFDTDFEERQQFSWDDDWGSGQVGVDEILAPFDQIRMKGPRCGYSRHHVEESLVSWLEQLYDEAPPDRES